MKLREYDRWANIATDSEEDEDDGSNKNNDERRGVKPKEVDDVSTTVKRRTNGSSAIRKRDPESANGTELGERLRRRGNELFEKGMKDEAIRCYEEALDVLGGCPDVEKLVCACHLNLAAIYSERSDFVNALKHSVPAVRGMPDDPFARKIHGLSLTRSGNVEQGVAHLERAHDLKKNDEDIRRALVEARRAFGTKLVASGDEAYARGDERSANDAVESYKKAMELSESSNPLNGMEVCVRLANAMVRAKRFDDAIQLLRRRLKRVNADLRNLDHMMRATKGGKNMRYEMNVRKANMHLLLGEVLNKINEKDGAVKSMRDALRVFDDLETRLSESEARLTRYVKTRRVVALQALGTLLNDVTVLRDGAKVLDEIQDRNGAAAVHLSIGHMLLKQRQFQDACAAFSFAEKRFDHDREKKLICLFGLSKAQRGVGAIELERETLERAMVLCRALDGAVPSELREKITSALKRS